mgnify:FL=1
MVDKKERDIKVVKYILIVFLVIAGLAVSKMTGVVSTRILLTLFIFLLVLPLVSALEHAKFPSWLATLIAVLVIVTVILFFVWFIFFTVDKLISMLPAYASRINDLDGVLKSLFSRWIDFPDDVSFLSSLNIDWVGSIIMPALKSVSSSAISIVSNVLLVLLMTVFLLMERNTIIPKLENFIVKKDIPNAYNVSAVWERIIRQVSRYISIKVFVSVITGALFYVACRIINLDFAFLWAVLAIVLNFIPTIGSILISVLVVLMAVIQFAPNLGPIIFIAISVTVIQNVIGNFVDPKLSGNSLNLSPFIILVSLGIFGYVWGIVGMFLSVPILSIVQIICANVKETRPIAMAISSGGSFKRQTRATHERKTPFKGLSKKDDDKIPDDVMFPDKN